MLATCWSTLLFLFSSSKPIRFIEKSRPGTQMVCSSFSPGNMSAIVKYPEYYTNIQSCIPWVNRCRFSTPLTGKKWWPVTKRSVEWRLTLFILTTPEVKIEERYNHTTSHLTLVLLIYIILLVRIFSKKTKNNFNYQIYLFKLSILNSHS